MEDRSTDQPSEVGIPDTELLEVSDSSTDLTYELAIGAPPTAGESKLPVLYALDGQWDFKLVMSLYGGLRYDMQVPEMIVVGISPTGRDVDYDTARMRDFAPTPDERFPGSGEADRFLEFLRDAVIPLVETRYGGDPSDRALTGSSLAGLFALHAMFNEPDLFRRIVAVSPAVIWNEPSVHAAEERLSQQRTELATRLYLAVGELEPSAAFVDPLERLVERLRQRSYTELQLTHAVIPGERHAGVKAEAFNRGIREVFAPEPVELPAETLHHYAGVFGQAGDDGLRLVLQVENGRLVVMAEAGSHDRNELLPVSDERFVFLGSIPGEAHFHRDESTVNRLSIWTSEAEIELDRLR